MLSSKVVTVSKAGGQGFSNCLKSMSSAFETVSQCLCGESKPRAKRVGECNERSNLISIRIYLDCHVHCRELAMTNEDYDTVSSPE